MKKNIFMLFVLVILFTNVPKEAWANVNKPFEDKDQNYNEHILISKSKYAQKTLNGLKDKLTPEITLSGNNRYMVKFREGISLDEINSLITGYNYKVIGRSNNHLFRIDIDKIEEFHELSKAKVEWIEKDAQEKLSVVPNDPNISSQWAINTLSLPEAWDISIGSNSIIVAVIDSGVSRNHSDLSNETILNGWDLIRDTYVDWDSIGHGTEVTGVIAATPNNNLGISGTCWNVSIMPISVVYNDGTIYSSDVAQAIYLAADSGCKVINLSLGGSTYSSAEDSAIQYAINKGCIVVAAAGNDGNSTVNYPASYNNVISVASVGESTIHSNFSNNNDYVDVSAPGEDILTTTEDNSYAYVAGTSFSAPYVSGIAALAASCVPSLTSTQFKNALSLTSADLGTVGYDTYYGYGLINAQRLLGHLTQPPALVTEVSFTKSSLTLCIGDNETLTAIFTPEDAANKSLTWVSGNTGVATVDSSGKVLGVGVGTTYISAMTDNFRTAFCEVIVRVPVTGVSLNKSSTTINVGADETLIATIAPASATNKNVNWTSGNTEVATVDSNGKIVGVSAGSTDIIVTTVDGSLSTSCKVMVSEKYVAQFLVELGESLSHGNTPGIYIGIMNIKDSTGSQVSEEKLASYLIKIEYDPMTVNIPNVYNEGGLGTLTQNITSGLVSISDKISTGFENNSNLIFMPIDLKGSALNTTNVTVHFSELQDQFLNSILADSVLLTFQRGKVLNDENRNPTIKDAVAGLQYLANIGTIGDAEGQVNPVNMASILSTDPGTELLKPSVKDIIALMQYLAGSRDDYFLVSGN